MSTQEATTNAPAAPSPAPAPHPYAGLAGDPATTTDTDGEGEEHVNEPNEEPGQRKVKPIQPRINELVRKQRAAEREADYWRGVAQGRTATTSNAPAPGPTPAAAPAAPKPTREQFANYDDFVEALSDWKAEARVATAVQAAINDVNARIEQRESHQSAAQVKANRAKNWTERAAATREVLPDFDDVLAAAQGAVIEPHTAELLEDSPHGPAIAYRLAKDPELLDKLNKLSPSQAAKEIGKMEAVFDGSAPPPAPAPNPHATKAPRPPSRVDAGASSSKDISKMSMDEYAAWRKAQGMR